MKSLKERIAVEQAYLDGKVIEYRNRDVQKYHGSLIRDLNHVFRWHDYDYQISDYQIKKEPRQVWITYYYENTPVGIYSTKPESVPQGFKLREFVEVVK